tara:strand:+ start:26 stop:526 length:501 start_codon:yes stop_codon:yes gene_type:complete
MDSIEKLLQDSNIVSIMNSVSNRYTKSIDLDEIESIKMVTLWKCRDKYDPTRGAKFTSFLYQQLGFAFKNELKKKKNMVYLDNSQLDFFGGGKTRSWIDRNLDHDTEFADMIHGLPEDVSCILKQRYIGNMTMVEIAKENGYSRETARRRLQRAIKICKKSNEYMT